MNGYWNIGTATYFVQIIVHFVLVLLETKNLTLYNGLWYLGFFLLFCPVTVLMNDNRAYTVYHKNQFFCLSNWLFWFSVII